VARSNAEAAANDYARSRTARSPAEAMNCERDTRSNEPLAGAHPPRCKDLAAGTSRAELTYSNRITPELSRLA